jgi:C-terminal processing protease CtpA/Prc
LAEEAWEIGYIHVVDFAEVVYSQFKEQLRDHHQQVGKQLTLSAHESEALARET